MQELLIPDMPDMTDRALWARDTARHLAALSEVQRSAVHLVYADGLLVADVAARLRLTVSEASAALSGALQALGRATVEAYDDRSHRPATRRLSSLDAV